MNGPRIDKWADLIRPTYEYPEELDRVGADLRGWRRRRAVQQARRDWRSSDRAARLDWIDAQQRRMGDGPPEGNIGVVGVVVLLIAGAVIVGALRSCQSPSAVADSVQQSPVEVESVVEPAPTESAVLDPTGPMLSPEEVSTSWAEAWLTFTATTGDTESAHWSRATPYMTPDLADWLHNPDPVVAVFLAEGTDVTVTGVEVQPPPKTAPADTPVRRSLLLVVTSSYTAGPQTGEAAVTRYLVTVMRTDSDSAWLVADFAGDTEG